MPPDMRVTELAALFRDNPEQLTLPIVQDGRPLGVVRRGRPFDLLAKPVPPGVVNKKPVTAVMETPTQLIDRGPFGRDQVATAGAADRMILMRRDMRADGRNLPYILDSSRTGVAQGRQQRFEAGRTGERMMVLHAIDLVGLGIGTFMPLMAWLSALGAPTRDTCRTGWRRWWIRGWRFGRVLGMLVEAR